MKITFRTPAQAALFMHEIQGQISDGYWSQDPRSQWRYWSRADVFVGENTGCCGAPGKRGFALEKLVPILGDRMINYAKLAIAFPKLGHNGCSMLEGAGYFPRLLEWASTGGSQEFYQKQVDAIDAEGGPESVLVALAAVDYTEKDLKADLKEMKATMKKDQQREETFQTERAIDRVVGGSENIGGVTLTQAECALLLDWMPLPADR